MDLFVNRRKFLALSALIAAYPTYRLVGSLIEQRRFHAFGGQLAKLKAELFETKPGLTGIAFLGDSITWGTGTKQGPNPNPRNGGLADPRDNFSSESFVNNLKRYIADKYMDGGQASVSNWRSSVAGQSIIEYSKPSADGSSQKRVRISNQGINGASTSSYMARNLIPGGKGANYAILPDDRFVFVQLGTNDRILLGRNPATQKELTNNLVALVSKIKPKADVILMCANPESIQSAKYRFGMDVVRSATFDAAKICEVDYIDNYAAFEGLDLRSLIPDGIHPSAAGHLIISQNIISAIEMS